MPSQRDPCLSPRFLSNRHIEDRHPIDNYLLPTFAQTQAHLAYSRTVSPEIAIFQIHVPRYENRRIRHPLDRILRHSVLRASHLEPHAEHCHPVLDRPKGL